jgi:hypothetical protein
VKCSVTNTKGEQCNRDVKNNNLCPGHNTRLIRKGDVLADLPLRAYTPGRNSEAPKFGQGDTDEERFFSLVVKSNDHWEWEGGITKSTGLGMTSLDNTPKTAGRASWELAFGPLPEGVRIKHACGNRLCVRPSHLAAVYLNGDTYVEWTEAELAELEIAA